MESPKKATDAEKIVERQSEATNDETLSELEKTEKIGDARKVSEREVPSPDSEPDGAREKHDDAGPM
jgi:hypothetical protein